MANPTAPVRVQSQRLLQFPLTIVPRPQAAACMPHGCPPNQREMCRFPTVLWGSLWPRHSTLYIVAHANGLYVCELVCSVVDTDAPAWLR